MHMANGHADFGGDWARDTHKDGMTDDYARDAGWSGAGRHDQYARDPKNGPADAIEPSDDEGAGAIHEEPIGKASE
jgi:hypothetical protein